MYCPTHGPLPWEGTWWQHTVATQQGLIEGLQGSRPWLAGDNKVPQQLLAFPGHLLPVLVPQLFLCQEHSWLHTYPEVCAHTLTYTHNTRSVSLLSLLCNTRSLNTAPSGLALSPPTLSGGGRAGLHTCLPAFLSCSAPEPGRLSLLPSRSSFHLHLFPLCLFSLLLPSVPPWSVVCVCVRVRARV